MHIVTDTPTNPFLGQSGADIEDHTGEHQHDRRGGGLDFDVWAYAVDDFYVVVGQQMLPQPMIDALGGGTFEPVYWTVILDDETTVLDVGSTPDDAARIPFAWLDEDARALVWQHAASGWVWDDVRHDYDLERGEWVPA